MPDEEVIDDNQAVEEEVTTDPKPDGSAGELVSEDPQDESTAFNDDVDDETDDVLEPREEVKEEVKDDKPAEVEEDEPEEEDEDDEDVKRGTELLETKQKAAEEQQTKEDEQKAEQQKVATETGTFSPTAHKNSVDDVKFFSAALPRELFPKENITLDDGTILDFEAFRGDNPELTPFVVGAVTNIIDQLISNGYLVSGRQVKSDMDGVYSSIDDRLFLRSVTNGRDGVPDAKEIHESDEFKGWLKEQPETIQALLDSSDPKDHIRIFKRYLGQAGLDNAKKKVGEIDGRRKKAKKKFDDIHKSTPRSRGKSAKSSARDNVDDEIEAFESEDEGDDII